MQEQETVCFQIGKPRDYGIYRGDVIFRKKSSMDSLFAEFYRINDFPEFYIGKTENVALCKDPENNNSELFDAKDMNITENLNKNSEITISYNKYEKNTLFQYWDNRIFHKFQMKSGMYMMLRQDFVDKLSSEDKRYLRIV